MSSPSRPQSPPDTTREQRAPAVLMVRPAAFGYNPETALTNRMQHPESPGSQAGSSAARARHEFDALAKALASAGVTVCVAEDTPEPLKPDAVFPNNWVSFHPDGTVVLYPMCTPSRRLERRQAVLDAVFETLGFKPSRIQDLTHHEAEGRFLEGTGSLVLDHSTRVAYACLSPRTHPAVVEEWAGLMGYRPILFNATDPDGVPIYHTNVLMSIGARTTVVGLAAISPEDRGRVEAGLGASGRVLVDINRSEIAGFAGNVLELRTAGGVGVLALSLSARQALRPAAFDLLSQHTDRLVTADIPTIERLGGGSVRCMLAEVFPAPLK